MQETPKLDFYDRVRVRTSDPAKSHLDGELGTVLGRSDTEDHPEPFLYAVDIDSCTDVWCFFESELQPTGERANPDDYFDGSSVNVRVDERGRGMIVPPESRDQ